MFVCCYPMYLYILIKQINKYNTYFIFISSSLLYTHTYTHSFQDTKKDQSGKGTTGMYLILKGYNTQSVTETDAISVNRV